MKTNKVKAWLKFTLPVISVTLLLFLPSSVVTPVMGILEHVVTTSSWESHMLGD